MKTLIILDEYTLGLLKDHPIMKLEPVLLLEEEYGTPAGDPRDFDFIIDTTFDQSPERLDYYSIFDEKQVILLSSVFEPITGLIHDLGIDRSEICRNIFTFNGLPGFVNRTQWEVSAMYPELVDLLIENLKPTGIEICLVGEQTGLIAARTVCLIINEAYLMVQEGAADKKDIDNAMKLGVNYPYGPFEWADLIGIGNVYNILINLRGQFGHERIKISDLLIREFRERNVVLSG